MSTSRVKKLFDHTNETAEAVMLNSAMTLAGAAVLSMAGDENPDAIRAAGMLAAGTVVTRSIFAAVRSDYNYATLFNQIKDGGVAKLAAVITAGQALDVLVGGALLLLTGSSLAEVMKNSAVVGTGTLLVAFPVACFTVHIAEKMINDFNAEHTTQVQQSVRRM